MEPKQSSKHITAFGYPLKDWLLIFALLGIGGTSAVNLADDTSGELSELHMTIQREFHEVNAALDETNRAVIRNTDRVSLLERSDDEIHLRIDTLQSTMMLGWRNADTYFRELLRRLPADTTK